MADVRDLDAEPYDPKRPQVNCDEASKQLMAETRVPLPAQPGKPALYDDAYQRKGTRTLLMCCEPQAGWRPMTITAHRTMQDFAQHMPWLVDARDPEADVMRVVLDHRNTHKPASLSEAFAPAEARRLVKQLALHDTPKHGSWLHMAAIELRILQGQCLERRIPDDTMRTREITAYEDVCHAAQATIVWPSRPRRPGRNCIVCTHQIQNDGVLDRNT